MGRSPEMIKIIITIKIKIERHILYRKNGPWIPQLVFCLIIIR